MPASEFSENPSPSSPGSDTSHAYSLDKKVGDGFSTLEVVPPSNLEHYKRLSEVTRSYNPNVPPPGQGIYTKNLDTSDLWHIRTQLTYKKMVSQAQITQEAIATQPQDRTPRAHQPTKRRDQHLESQYAACRNKYFG